MRRLHTGSLIRNSIKAAAALFLATAAQTAMSQSHTSYDQFVVAEDVVVRWINGEQRFCQRRNLKGNICGQQSKIGGKTFFEVMDWFRAETFVQAYTGFPRIEVLRVEPGVDSSTLVIYFKQL